MARKIESTYRKAHSGPFGSYAEKLDRALRHGWRSVGFCVVNGKRYVELTRVYKDAGYINNKYFTVCLSITTGEIISPHGARN